MILLKTWLETVNYRVTEGNSYQWQCFGPNTHCLTSWDGNHNGSSFNIVFDTKTQVVYCVEAHDYKHDRAYRMINPDYAPAYYDECKIMLVSDEAWEGVAYVDLDVAEDWLEKARAICAGETYDTRVKLPIDLDDTLLFDLMKQAHERDVTLNQHIEFILQQVIGNRA